MIKIAEKGLFNSIDEFQFIQDKNIGTGSFGVVKLAIHSRTYRVYALKIISLQNITSEAELKLLQRQIKIHSHIQHPHIVKLWDTIIDENNIYMVLQYAESGNLFYYQNKKVTFPEGQAYKFFMQTVEAVRYLHQNDILHRDLKPQNLLLDTDYNIKLCDFGWCTDKITNKKNTFCGTYEYMSPQMIFGRQYDYRIDIWALGILLYEMLHGNAPFKGESAKQVKQKMLRGSYNISSDISDQGKDLLMGILKFNPDDRFSIEDILQHPWVQNLAKIMMTQFQEQRKFNHKNLHNRMCRINLEKVQRKNEYTPSKESVSKAASTIIPSFHKKTASMDIESKKNLNINLSINNYAVYPGKKNRQQQRKLQNFSQSKRKEEKRCQTQNDESHFETDDEQKRKKNHKMMKMESLKKAERKSKVQQKGNFKINPSAANLNNKHRRSQQQVLPKSHFRYKTDMEISSKNLAKFSSGNILKKSRTKQLTQNTKLTKNHNNIKSQNCLGLTQKLKKK